MLDLGRATRLGGIEVDWEYPDLAYSSLAERSDDGARREPLAIRQGQVRGAPRLSIPGRVRRVRIRPSSLSDAKRASIREVRLFGPEGKPIENRRVEALKGPGAPDFDGSAWRALDVPHHCRTEGPFRDDLNNNTGKVPWKGRRARRREIDRDRR